MVLNSPVIKLLLKGSAYIKGLMKSEYSYGDVDKFKIPLLIKSE